MNEFEWRGLLKVGREKVGRITSQLQVDDTARSRMKEKERR